MTMPWPAELPTCPVRHLRALVSCDAMSEELPLVVDGSRRPSPAMAEHLHTCLRCQAELAGYRRLLRVLRSLREEPVSFPAPDLVGDAAAAPSRSASAGLQEHVGRGRRRAAEPVGGGRRPWPPAVRRWARAASRSGAHQSAPGCRRSTPGLRWRTARPGRSP